MNILEACRKYGVKNLVYADTSDLINDVDYKPNTDLADEFVKCYKPFN